MSLKSDFMYIVYYNDDFPDNGGVGIKTFEYERQALDFILERMNDKEATLDRYKLFSGNEVKLKVIEKVKDIGT